MDPVVHITAKADVDSSLVHPSCKLIYKSIGKTAETIDTKRTLSKTLLINTREDQQGKSPRNIYIRAKTANIAVPAFAITTEMTEAPSLKQIYDIGSISNNIPPTTI